MKPLTLSILSFALLAPTSVDAGAFLTSINFAQTEEAINHPVLYVGASGVRTIRVCLDPAIADVAVREPIVERAIATWNAMLPESGNLSDDVPDGLVDFESTLLHEMGHCLFGLAHTNLGLLVDDVTLGFATLTDTGPNGFFDIGVTSQPGAADDLRGDDVNRFWFSVVDNYPYLLTPPVDSTTYSRDLDDLPPTSSFAANPNRLSGTVATPPVTGTEAVMNGYGFPGEGRRALQHDDVATFLLAASGLDETANTADDYSVDIVYQGRTLNDCDVIIEDLPASAPDQAIGFCETGAIGIGGPNPHFRLAGVSRLQLSSDAIWFYGPAVFSDGFETGNTGAWSLTVP